MLEAPKNPEASTSESPPDLIFGSALTSELESNLDVAFAFEDRESTPAGLALLTADLALSFDTSSASEDRGSALAGLTPRLTITPEVDSEEIPDTNPANQADVHHADLLRHLGWHGGCNVTLPTCSVTSAGPEALPSLHQPTPETSASPADQLHHISWTTGFAVASQPLPGSPCHRFITHQAMGVRIESQFWE